MFSPRGVENHLKLVLYILIIISGESEDIGLCKRDQFSLQKHMSTVYLICGMIQFSIISFMVVYITNDSKETKERLVTGSWSPCGSRRRFTR